MAARKKGFSRGALRVFRSRKARCAWASISASRGLVVMVFSLVMRKPAEKRPYECIRKKLLRPFPFSGMVRLSDRYYASFGFLKGPLRRVFLFLVHLFSVKVVNADTRTAGNRRASKNCGARGAFRQTIRWRERSWWRIVVWEKGFVGVEWSCRGRLCVGH